MSVRWVGAQRYMLGGDIDGKVNLRALMGRPHLYALGPRVGVSGEITVFDGTPCIARVIDGRIRLEDSADHAVVLRSSTIMSRPGTKPSSRGRSTTRQD